MADRINTGGLRSFESTRPDRDPELEKQIDLGYKKAEERKRRNRILWIMGIIIVLVVLGLIYFFTIK